ncbi:hypothetical protein QQS21_012825 [Conoideocrella luteorostrata]|uniref:Glutamine amidotransferase type-2 domain-containing protein n=1 Tax=Conoideocrella luteorostrata TaxID=1105319 RepID=A0AAJ0FS45_9HYPO|nr:hypothetical protein QQS21_012825 [Conoideocrella luteorostrata]
MCGIVAYCACKHVGRESQVNGSDVILYDSSEQERLAEDLQKALDLIKYRGPDGSGVWISQTGYVGLGHCRLSINDLSPAGLQPLHSEHIHAVVNGEIYDYDQLRMDCIESGYKFTSTSDSELVVALYKRYGTPALFKYLRGEFAFVLYDGKEERVIAGRDRYGIKPLMWTIIGDKIVFGAEAKAFLAMGWKPEWDVHAISDCGWMSDDRTIFKGVKKLLPGQWMEISSDGTIQTHTYWDAEYPEKARTEIRNIDDMILQVREKLIEAVRTRMKADVPVGVYLSGGIDSSAVAGIMAHLAREEHVNLGSERSTRVSCFTIQFPDGSTHNESEIADRTAEWLGVKIHKKYVDEQQFANDFEDAAYHSEHHNCDLNNVAKYALSSLTRECGVKVVLTGEGSDEHFAGYSFVLSYFLQQPDWSMPDETLAMNEGLRETLYKSANSESARVWEAQGYYSHEANSPNGTNGPAAPESWFTVAFQPKQSLFSPWVRNQYGGIWDRGEAVLASCTPEVREKMLHKWHPGHTALYLCIKSFLPNIILAGVGDRTEMAHSIEGRPPFLDHVLSDYINMLPPSVKAKYSEEQDRFDAISSFWWKDAGSGIRAQTEKWILREAVKPFVTEELYRRRKQPFLAPMNWPVNGPLHQLFMRILTKEAIENLGFVDYATVEEALRDAFGEDAKPEAFKTVINVGAWVTLGRRFGIQKASVENSAWA